MYKCNLGYLSKKKGLSLKKISEVTGINQSTLYCLSSRKNISTISLVTIFKLIEILDSSFEELFEEVF